MSGFKGTPGPWRVGLDGALGTGVFPSFGELRTEGGPIIACWSGCIGADEARANAHLTVAAYDLLAAALAWEAAEDARNDCDGEDGCDNEGPWEHCPFCSVRFGEAINMRHAAISRALGTEGEE